MTPELEKLSNSNPGYCHHSSFNESATRGLASFSVQLLSLNRICCWDPSYQTLTCIPHIFINSLVPGRSAWDFKNIIFNFVLLIGKVRSSYNDAFRWMLRDLTDDKSTLVQVMAWCRQAASHYPSQSWPRSMTPYGISRPQCVKTWRQIRDDYDNKCVQLRFSLYFGWFWGIKLKFQSFMPTTQPSYTTRPWSWATAVPTGGNFIGGWAMGCHWEFILWGKRFEISGKLYVQTGCNLCLLALTWRMVSVYARYPHWSCHFRWWRAPASPWPADQDPQQNHGFGWWCSSGPCPGECKAGCGHGYHIWWSKRHFMAGRKPNWHSTTALRYYVKLLPHSMVSVALHVLHKTTKLIINRHMDGFVQDCGISTANTLEIQQSFTKTSPCIQIFHIQSSATITRATITRMPVQRDRSLAPKPRPHHDMPSWPSPSQVAQAHGQKVWNHRGLIGHSGNDTPLFPYKWNKTKVSHLLVMSIQSIHYWSSIKHTDYSSPMLWECHHSANMAARRLDVENNPGSNQVNISHTHIN